MAMANRRRSGTFFSNDHHDGYIEWDECERDQARLAASAYGQKGGANRAAVGPRCFRGSFPVVVAGGAGVSPIPAKRNVRFTAANAPI